MRAFYYKRRINVNIFLYVCAIYTRSRGGAAVKFCLSEIIGICNFHSENLRRKRTGSALGFSAFTAHAPPGLWAAFGAESRRPLLPPCGKS